MVRKTLSCSLCCVRGTSNRRGFDCSPRQVHPGSGSLLARVFELRAIMENDHDGDRSWECGVSACFRLGSRRDRFRAGSQYLFKQRFFQNKFNYNVRQILHPHDHAISDATRVIAVPTVGLGVYSNPDRVICDGSSRELKVGIGEIKAPWVLETAGAMAFVNRLPIEHFGEDFVAVTPWRDIQRNVGKGLTQLYHDMIMDGMTVGFLATTEVFFFCLINPEDRTDLRVFTLKVHRADVPRSGPLPPFTVQVGLATLAWMGRVNFSQPKPMPEDLETWSNHPEVKECSLMHQ
jgi:hypothetical protein